MTSPPSPSIYRDPVTPDAPRRGPLVRLARLLFGLEAPVGRGTYAIAGVLLFLLKYGIDASLLYAATRRVWPPLHYVTPLLTVRIDAIGRDAPAWLEVALVLVSLPFLWIGLSMTARRAADAGFTPWLSLLFLVPFLNYLAIVGFCMLPSEPGAAHPPTPSRNAPPPSLLMAESRRRALLALLVCTPLGLGITGISVFVLRSYGMALFVAGPGMVGALAAYVYNRPVLRRLQGTLLVVLLVTFATGLSLMLFAAEGLLCLVMAFPLGAAFATLGGLLGYMAASLRAPSKRTAALPLLLLPGAAALEAKAIEPQLHEVSTAIEIDAPPEAVWPNVVGFSELPPPSEWVFRYGIAYPLRARIEGEGIGAVRHCEFSTGPFVEPITRWEPPARLGFDVSSQPPSMQEWSPYAHVNAPHLEGYMVSRRGEFRLVPLAGGRTRLEGSTWYTLAIFPEIYWVGYSDALLHAIHGRVLRHIRDLSERTAQPQANR
jgi:uncharacterized membrane protein YhaH (DUF805 family)